MDKALFYDVAIIGAGPVGCYAAKRLSEQQISVALIEQHKCIGHPINCAGLVSPRVFETFDLPKDQLIQNTITTARIHSPDNTILTIGGDKPHAYRIDRSKFDAYLADEAKKQGTNIFLGEKALSIQRDPTVVNIETSKEHNIQTDILIGSDGPYSRVRDVFGLPEPKEYLQGIGAQLNDTNLDGSTVEIFVGNKIAPGFFAWIIPTNDKGTSAHIGLCLPKNIQASPKKYLQSLLENPKTKDMLAQSNIEYYTGGIIPLGALKQTVDDRVLLVGDAAAQVKPTSGGGIYPGLLCADHAVNSISKALEKQEYTLSELQTYHNDWRQDIGKELSMGMYFRKLYTRLSDEQFDKYIKKFQQDSIVDIITEHGDIDYPSRLVKPLLKKTPSLLRILTQLVV